VHHHQLVEAELARLRLKHPQLAETQEILFLPRTPLEEGLGLEQQLRLEALNLSGPREVYFVLPDQALPTLGQQYLEYPQLCVFIVGVGSLELVFHQLARKGTLALAA
jgi:hypothetical protein